MQEYVEVPVVLENVSSYAEFHDSEMTEWEFLTEVVERADCGILLDVNNIYVSSINHEFDPAEYVDFIPAERVAQMHIAGHSRYERFILDTHDHPVIDPVWKLYERALATHRADGDAAGVGRPHSSLRRGSRRGDEGEEVSGRGDRLRRASRGTAVGRSAVMTALLEFQRTLARAVMQPLSTRDNMKRGAE